MVRHQTAEQRGPDLIEDGGLLYSIELLSIREFDRIR